MYVSCLCGLGPHCTLTRLPVFGVPWGYYLSCSSQRSDKHTGSSFHAGRIRLGWGGGWTGLLMIYWRSDNPDFKKCPGSRLLFSYTNFTWGSKSGASLREPPVKLSRILWSGWPQVGSLRLATEGTFALVGIEKHYKSHSICLPRAGVKCLPTHPFSERLNDSF